MLKYLKHRKICNCSIPSDKNILNPEIENSFCQKCGSIIIKIRNGGINYTLKPKQKQKPIAINPINIIKTMKERTEINYPYLKNEYNKFNEEQNNIYLKHRKMILVHLQKLMKLFDYDDIVFYHCLFFMDYCFSRIVTEEMTEKEIIYYLIGYFLCSTKMKETDISEPPLEAFLKIKKNLFLSLRNIAYYEVLCLKSINYNIFSFSAYDWLIQLIQIGIIFDSEIDGKNPIIMINGHRHTIINSINKYALKFLLNITSKNVFIKYTPRSIAFSITQIARDKFLDKNLIKENLFDKLLNLYEVNFNEYKNCYEELKSEIPNNIIFENEKNNIDVKNNDIIINKDKLKAKITKKISMENSSNLSLYYKHNKLIYLNKHNSNKSLMNYNDINSLNDSFNQTKKIDDKNNYGNNRNENNIHLNRNKSLVEENDRNNRFYQANQINIGLKKIIPKKLEHLSIDCKKKTANSNDSLPMISSQSKPKIELIKENMKKIVQKSSKALKNYNDFVSKISKPKKIIKYSNFAKNSRNTSTMNQTLFQSNSTKNKSIFKVKSNISIHGNIKLKKSSKFLSQFNRDEDTKVNTKIEII